MDWDEGEEVEWWRVGGWEGDAHMEGDQDGGKEEETLMRFV